MTAEFPLTYVTCPDATCPYPNPANMETIATCAAVGTDGRVDCMKGYLLRTVEVEPQGGGEQ